MQVERTYNRTWEQIELMLDRAEKKMKKWKDFFEDCRERGDRDGMKDAARNKKALEGVVKTLRWVLGDKNIRDLSLIHI